MKHCLTCKHCTIDEGWGGTDVTPGTPGEWRCAKGKWPESPGDMYADLRPFVLQCFTIGETCMDWADDERVGRPD